VSTDISCESPFTEPDLIFDQRGLVSFRPIAITSLASLCKSWLRERLVEMMVHRHQVDIIVGKEVVPLVSIKSERVMENEIGIRRISLNHHTHLSVEVFQDREISVPPRLVHRLESFESAMAPPSLQETL
jgi:hypothetical protein